MGDTAGARYDAGGTTRVSMTTYAARTFGRLARQNRTDYMDAVDAFLDQVADQELLPLLDITTHFYQGYLTGLKHA